MSSTINDLKTPSSDTRLVLYDGSYSMQSSDLYDAVKPYEGQNKFLVFEVQTGNDGTYVNSWGTEIMSVDRFISVYDSLNDDQKLTFYIPHGASQTGSYGMKNTGYIDGAIKSIYLI